jgi:uncharacterized protein
MRLIAVLVMVVGIMTSSIGFARVSGQAITEEMRLQAAQQTAQVYLDAAVAGNYNGLFDYMHPDVLAEVPRSVALQIFSEIYGATNPGKARITDVNLGSYTWPVNNKTYDDAVEVSYEQEFTDQSGRKQTLETKMYLAPFQGQYRWFFGNSRAYIADASARFAPPTQTGQPSDINELLQFVVEDLDTFYRTSFDAQKMPYRTPGVKVVPPGRSAMTACGPASPGFWAFYCPPDQTVYLDQAFLGDLNKQYGDYAVSFVVGHEWAHHVQTEMGIDRTARKPTKPNEVYSIELELMADCLTGVWSRDLDARNFLDLQDLAEASAFIFQRLGDPNGIDEFDPQAHGNSDQRTDAFSDGYDGGFTGCSVNGLSPVRS